MSRSFYVLLFEVSTQFLLSFLFNIMLRLLLLAALIRLYIFFLMYFLTPCRDVSTQSKYWQLLFLSLFSWPIEAMPSLGCIDLCIVINFLEYWFIFFSSSLVHFKNGLKYLARRTSEVFIPLKIFLLQSLVSRKFFFVLQRYSLLIFSFLSVCLMVSSFLLAFWSFPNLVVLFLLLFHFSPCITSMAHFSARNSIPISCLYIRIVCTGILVLFSFRQISWYISSTCGFIIMKVFHSSVTW